MISIKFDIFGSIDRLKEAPLAGYKALVSSSNKLAKKIVVDVDRFIRTDYNIKKREVTQAVKQAGGATAANPIACVSVSSERIPLIDFGGRWRKGSPGATVQVKHGKSALIPHTFTATTKSGHTGVFSSYRYSGWQRKRRKPVPRREKRGRWQTQSQYTTELPVDELTGPSVAGLFHSAGAGSEIQHTMIGEGAKIFEHEFGFWYGS